VTGTSEELGDFRITFLRPTADSGEDVQYSRCLEAAGAAAVTSPTVGR